MKKYFYIFIFLFTLIPSFVRAETISNITIFPELDVSYFAPYKIKADISGAPTSVSVDIKGINGDGGSVWNYYADGTPESYTKTKTMTYDVGEGKYISTNIYPDDIYPEIFFAPSSVTWNNIPSSIDTRRNSYHLLHFNNPFSMIDGASFFVEINAVPRSTVNSANLEVYIVKKGKDITFFNSDWRNSLDVENIGFFDKNSVFHHTHVAGKSAHHLLPLTLNADGTIGTKSLDISGDFWIILYSNSPNTARGWDLRYHNSSLCNNTDRWYIGSQSGWTTTNQSGCPDSHIHTARRSLQVADGANATITANYATESPVIQTQNFSFLALPNLAPNVSSFISPIAGGVYTGGLGPTKTLDISWNPATDPNGDNVLYNIYLLDGSGVQIGPAILSNSSSNSFTFDITGIANGNYGLRGEACDTAPLCTTFTLSDHFIINKIVPIYSLSNISITSNNSNDSSFAKSGDTVSLSFEVSDSGDISPTLDVSFYSGGLAVNNIVTKSNIGNVWTATYTVSENDTDGHVDFIIQADNLAFEYSSTNNNSYVISDNTDPDQVLASPSSGNYTSSKSISLTSIGSSKIVYTSNNEEPSCDSGTIYSSNINLSESTTIKAIACDNAGNYSSVISFPYEINKPNSYGSYVPNLYNKATTQLLKPNISCTTIKLTRDIKLTKPPMKGDDIKYLQNYLNDCQNTTPILILDGIYGPKTKNAIIIFQKSKGLLTDGIIGPKTRLKLQEF